MGHETLWWTAIVLAVVVTVVVAVLLTAILRTAKDIEAGAAVVWANGQRVANNTIHIPLLYRTNEAVSTILERAGGILATSNRIAAHAQDCPGCPNCIVGGRV
ncbi:MAG: hypothetical protein ROR55_07095 [Devosia sp.]